MTDDPRVTRIGRVLRSTSIDELPQLLNVIAGTMSLVGPRPALPSEVAEFSPELRHRESVTPGITGLWQVEARDNPSFEAYRRLDLFYVENWSITLDLMIVIGTLEQLVVKLFATVRSGKGPEPAATITTLAEANRFGDGTDLANSQAS
jgi:lipopolysaccharide/colanic/teichoic acid biosynthesis glycosyltransferase